MGEIVVGVEEKSVTEIGGLGCQSTLQKNTHWEGGGSLKKTP